MACTRGMNAWFVPKTEGIKYAGSKLKIIPRIVSLLASQKLSFTSVLDVFSGTTRVSQAFSQLGFSTTANDISEWSEVFATCYLLSFEQDHYYQDLLDHLNALEGRRGWFTEHYGGVGEMSKRPFQEHNTQKLDAIREELERLQLPWIDKCVLLTSLIYALDSVDNTLGHYAAYLSKWSARSYHTMELKLPRRFHRERPCSVLREDAFLAVDRYHDLMYLDPPYGSNNEKMPPSRVRYSAYYHIWKTIVLNDQPELFGKANRRVDSRDALSSSVFEEFRRDEAGHFIAMNAIDRLIEKANCRYILLSYSSGGRATKGELYDIISRHGCLLDAVEFDYKKNVMATMTWSREWVNQENTHKEYLFLMKK